MRRRHRADAPPTAAPGGAARIFPKRRAMTYPLILLLLGLAVLGVAWLPTLLEEHPLSHAIVFVALGAAIYALPWPTAITLPSPDPVTHGTLAVHLSELAVIVALTATGLKLDRPFAWRAWRVPIRLATVAMVATIALVALVAHHVAGLPWAESVLLGAVLAPTDPVLAGDVQVEGPNAGGEDEVRFGLTGEAGLNDGLAFPFVWLALFLAGGTPDAATSWGGWLLRDVAWRLAAGVGIGFAIGRLLAPAILARTRHEHRRPEAFGVVALAITLTSYGAAELAKGYGFLAVFVAAVALRHWEREHAVHQEMHDFTDQAERLLLAGLLLLFGGALVRGLLAPLAVRDWAVVLGLLVVVRPLVARLVLAGTPTQPIERRTIAWFGIRGIGSIYYLAFALSKTAFVHAPRLWAITGTTILVSVVAHGILATPVMTALDRRRARHGGGAVPHGGVAEGGVVPAGPR